MAVIIKEFNFSTSGTIRTATLDTNSRTSDTERWERAVYLRRRP